MKIHQKNDAFNSIRPDANTSSAIRTEVRNFHLLYRESGDSGDFKSRKSSVTENKMSCSNRMSSHLEGSVLGSAVKHIHRQYYGLQTMSEHFKNKGTQTDYRESECQTLPWEPEYKTREGHKPEVLTLAHFTWGDGLPAGVHEIDIINRMRKKRAWEQVLPPMDTPANIKTRSALITALEADEWAFREAEIQFIMNLRMDLEDKIMQSKESEKKQKAEDRFKKLDERLGKRKQREIENIRNRFWREMRKLSMKHKSVKTQHDKRDIIKLHAARDLDFHDLKPRYSCTQIVQKNRCEEDIFDDLENNEQLPSWLLSARKPRYSAPKSSMRICSRKQKRNEMKLRELCQNVDSIRANIELTDSCSLMKRKEKMPSLPPTPRRSPDNSCLVEDDVDQASNSLQNLVKERAIQCKIFEGRNRYRELIKELQVARELEERSEASSETSRIKLFEQEHEDERTVQEQRVNEVMDALEGKTIAFMLTFLTDELTRLQGEKKAHALALLAERERIKQEIAQASKEQLEVNQRQELDETFRLILKVNQESVETYLEDIVRDGIEWISETEAKKYIIDLADKTDAMTKHIAANSDKIDTEGMVADMVCNFVLPQVDKELSRKRLHERQTSHLCAAHESIYHEILNIPAEDLLSERTLSDCSNSAVEKFTSYQSENEENNEIEISCETNNNERTFDSIIELILDYSAVPNEEHEADIRAILEQILWEAGKNDC